MTKNDKANMVNEAIARSDFALSKKCAARVVDGSLFYTMLNRRGREVFVPLSEILFTLHGDDIRAIKGNAFSS